MNKFYLFTFLLFAVSFARLNAQGRKCATMRLYQERVSKDPGTIQRMENTERLTQSWISRNANLKSNSIVTIPVVVHVLYNNSTENISDLQIQSQIDILNQDFRLLNTDSLPQTHPFWTFSADSRIEFCLASRDPNGNATSGITRTYTDSTTFIGIGNEKFSSNGGANNWDPTKYLNIWVCNLDGSGGTLGYATFPSDLSIAPNEDGVVIRYQAFGNTGTVVAPNDLGRTATHEVGHWLNLRHIWGDAVCGDDFVTDTEIAEDANYNCPTFPHKPNGNCSQGANGEMYMNYMDYVDDNCMNMFTAGQANRMNAALNTDRAGLLTSPGCSAPSGVNNLSLHEAISISPNPNKGIINITLNNNLSENFEIEVYDLLGLNIYKSQNVNNFPVTLYLNELPNGIYCVKVSNQKESTVKKIIVSK